MSLNELKKTVTLIVRIFNNFKSGEGSQFDAYNNAYKEISPEQLDKYLNIQSNPAIVNLQGTEISVHYKWEFTLSFPKTIVLHGTGPNISFFISRGSLEAVFTIAGFDCIYVDRVHRKVPLP